jgi:hypothetical protein
MPGAVGVAGQFWVITSTGVVVIAQVELAEFVTGTPQTLVPVAVEVLVVEQLVGVK